MDSIKEEGCSKTQKAPAESDQIYAGKYSEKESASRETRQKNRNMTSKMLRGVRKKRGGTPKRSRD